MFELTEYSTSVNIGILRVKISHVTLSCSQMFIDLNWLLRLVMWSMGFLFYDGTVDMQIWALLTSQCRSSLFLSLILVFLHRIEQLKTLVFDSSSDTSFSIPDSSCHHKRRQRKYWKYSSSPSRSKKKKGRNLRKGNLHNHWLPVLTTLKKSILQLKDFLW